MAVETSLADRIAIRLESIVTQRYGQDFLPVYNLVKKLSGIPLIETVWYLIEPKEDIPEVLRPTLESNGIVLENFRKLGQPVAQVLYDMYDEIELEIKAQTLNKYITSQKTIPKEFGEDFTRRRQGGDAEKEIIHASAGGNMQGFERDYSTFAPVQVRPREQRPDKKYFEEGTDFVEVFEQIDEDVSSEDIFTGLFRLLRVQERHMESMLKRFMSGDRRIQDKDIINAVDSVRKIYDTIGKYQVAADMIVRAADRLNVQVQNTYNQYIAGMTDENKKEIAGAATDLVTFMKQRAKERAALPSCECDEEDIIDVQP